MNWLLILPSLLNVSYVRRRGIRFLRMGRLNVQFSISKEIRNA